MAHQSNITLNNSNKPSKLLALIALIVAFSLPFILVKTFPDKKKSTISSNTFNPSKSSPDEEKSTYSVLFPPPLSPTTPPHTISTSSTTSTIPPILTQPSTFQKSTNLIEPDHNNLTAEDKWTIIETRKEDSLANIFKRVGLSAQALHIIMHETKDAKILSKLKPKQELRLLIKNHLLEKMIIPLTNTKYLTIYRDKEHYKSKINLHKTNSYNHFLTATVHGSLYKTAKRYNIPYTLIQQMTEIFTWDIDFAKDVKAGDQFTIIYKALYIENKLVNVGDIVAVSYRKHGKTFQAILHTNRKGQSEYFTPEGKSFKKAFTRYPLNFSHISSAFSMSRYHPILHYMRAHKGVDLAARIGTPIQTTGDGYIEIIGRQSAYGNMIKIKHNKIYSTIYGHMLKFAKGLLKGTFVKRGQIIGYVGQTGLASGPHCHYEFHINNQPKNPTTIDLPHGAPISGRELAVFKTNSTILLAQLKHFETTHLASNLDKKRHQG